jgi:hypothetical protein
VVFFSPSDRLRVAWLLRARVVTKRKKEKLDAINDPKTCESKKERWAVGKKKKKINNKMRQED